MNLFNRKVLNQRIVNYSFPNKEKAKEISKLIINWQKALKDSDLSKTKEKSIQGKFLNVFFEQILGYVDKTGGEVQWTLVAEPKTEVDAQTADGAIGFFTKSENLTVGVIELKDAKTSLDKKQKSREKGYSPVEQAYLYATKFDRCKWIVVSNFREIRLYNKSRSEQYFEKFDLLQLHKEEEFKRFYFLLNKENLISLTGESSIDDLANKSEAQEEDISKKFYLDYRAVRLVIYEHLVQHNNDTNRKILLEKAQKILDRVVFILFCEDTANLLPQNILKDTYQLGIKSRDRSDEKVWREMKNLFIDIDEGRKDIEPEINSYNGGLFKVDEILNKLVIKDDVWKNIIKLTDYDFETDLNVNILGHIFEQSISDIEVMSESLVDVSQNVSNSLANIDTQPKATSKKVTSKRKKDGIFYTPEYITKYIVENTVGKYLEENPDKLSTIKVLDPACGSGAFLNQAHSYLLNEYKVRHEHKLLEKKEKGEAITLFDYNPAEANKSILLNNLYGVDLNDESVEITKLSLWLKTARKDEKLQNLDGNIKVGNSLIDDPVVAENKAFKWESEYKTIMKEGGFDVIIGNPPYVRNELISQEHKNFYLKNYKETYTGKSDLYVFFFEKYIQLLKEGGYGAMIVSSKYTKTKYGKFLIDFLENNTKIVEYIDFTDSEVFEGITAYPSIIIFQKLKSSNNISKVAILGNNSGVINDLTPVLINSFQKVDQSKLFRYIGGWRNGDNNKPLFDLIEKLVKQCNQFKNIFTIPQVGIKTGLNDSFIIDDIKKFNPYDPQIKPYILGKDIKRYSVIEPKKYIIFPYKSNENGFEIVKENELSSEVLSYLNRFRSKLESRAIIKEGILTGKKVWYEYQQIRLDFNYSNYIIYPDISNGVNFTLAKNGLYDMTCFGIPSSDKNLLGLLNSKLIRTYLQNCTVKARGGYLRLKSQYINKIPIPNNYSSLKIQSKVEDIMSLRKQSIEMYQDLLELLKSNFNKSVKLSLSEFLNLGSNQIVSIFDNWQLPFEKQESLEKWLRVKQHELSIIQSKIIIIEVEIDQEIYKLYGLSNDEISIVEKYT